jgi:hypothetical protein
MRTLPGWRHVKGGMASQAHLKLAVHVLQRWNGDGNESPVVVDLCAGKAKPTAGQRLSGGNLDKQQARAKRWAIHGALA